MRNFLLLITLLIAVAVSFWLLPAQRSGTGEAGESGVQAHGSGKAAIGGSFILTDQRGQVRHDTDFAGQYRLIYFGFTYCPDICPIALLTMTDALSKLGTKAERITPIFITLDPDRDTPAQMQIYAGNFHPKLVALSGTADQIKSAADAYKIYYAKVNHPDGGGYTIDHSGFIYLMNPVGEYLAHFPHNVAEETLVEALKGYVK